MPRLKVLLATLFLAAPAHAGGDEPGWTMVIFHAINLTILIWLIVRYAGKPIARALEARADSVAREIDEATRLHAEARGMLDEYEAKVSALEAETSSIVSDLRAQGEAEKERLVAEARVDAERIRRDAERAAQSEMERARRKLEAEVVDLAIASAERAIREKLTPADHRRLTGEYLSRLEESNRA